MEWGVVCDDGWSFYDSQVACRQLGYSSMVDPVPYYEAHFGRGSGDILLGNLYCNGSEDNLYDCQRDTYLICDHSEDAGLLCSPGK